MKATHVYITSLKMDDYGKVRGKEIFKDPVTGDGRKKSAKGLLSVVMDKNLENYELVNNCTPEQEEGGMLQLIFGNGNLYNSTTLMEIRTRVDHIVANAV